MATRTLNQPIQHKAFKRTFLQDVTAKVTFAETDLLSDDAAIRSFLHERFGVADNINIPNLGGIEIVSDNKWEKYIFSTSSAMVTMASDIYRCYDDSLNPRLDILISFLQTLGIKEVETLSIKKRNLFQAKANNAFQSWRIALGEAFKIDNIKQMAAAPNVTDEPFKMSIEGSKYTKWGEIKVPFMIEVPDKSGFKFHLDLEAISGSMRVSELQERAVVMNNDIYVAFTNIVSDKLLNLMLQD